MRKSLVIVLLFGFMFFSGGCITVAQVESKEGPPALSDEEAIKTVFSELKNIYYDENLDTFMSYFSEDDYPAYDTLEEDMEYTFDNNQDLTLNIIVTSLTVSGKSAIAKVDWDKAWDDSSSSNGTNNTIRLKKIGGSWKIVDLENDSIFVVGTGTVRSYATE